MKQATSRIAVAALLWALATQVADAQTSYPMIMSLQPVAAQVGATSEHTISSRYSMYGADSVIVSGEGVTGEILHPEKKPEDEKSPPNLQTMKVRFTVAPDALPGVRDFRITTPRGVSTLGQLVIATDPVVVEAKDNNTQPQAVEVPATLCGRIEQAEDLDLYQFTATAGTQLTFHVRSMRLQNRIHDLQQHSDPILTLRSASGVTLAQSDNHFFGDPFIAHRFDADGEYVLEIRDVRYQGNKYWEYSIEVADRPFVTNLYPLGVPAEQAIEVEPVGFHLPSDEAVPLQTPSTLGPARVAVVIGGQRTNPAPLIVSELPLQREAESEMGNNAPDQAELISVPSGINGRIASEADIDCFAFEAKKGEKFSFDVKARRHGSALDSHLRILNAEGRALMTNDDLRLGKRNSSDSWIEDWAAPADGRYIIELRDLHLRGGAEFVYFLEVTRAQPYFELYVDTDKTQLTPGTSGIIFVRVVRKNGFTGAVDLAIDGLPAGVSASCGRILPEKAVDGCIVLTADENAAPAAANVRISGTGVHMEGAEQLVLQAEGLPYQETYMPGGGRGHFPVGTHTVSVAAPNDIRAVQLSDYEVTLKPGQSKKIAVTLERAEGFDKNVSLDVIYKHLNSVYGNSLPEGVTLDAAASKILLTKGASEGHIVLKAADNAPPVEAQQIAVMANVSLNFVMKATYASRPLEVTVLAK